MNEFEKRLGIIQGRLLPPIDNHIQEFPINNWKEEFDHIDGLKISFIEWIVTKKSYSFLFDLNLNEYSHKISSICCDHIIDDKIVNKDFIENNLIPICDFSLKNNIKNLTIPLLEESSINENNFHLIRKNFIDLANTYNKLNFYFEIDAHYNLVKEFISSHKNFLFTYDTGNLTSSGYNHSEYIKAVFEYIGNVHLKDRTINPPKTVKPLLGNTDFFIIFNLLNKMNYKGNFILQTAREKKGFELETIQEHKKIFENLFYEQHI